MVLESLPPSRVVSRAAWRMAMEVRKNDVRAHVIALRASTSWYLEQKAECIARRL
jgi:hypothetical protein